MTGTWQSRHRGPYQFLVMREFATKPGFYRGEWLRGAIDSDDVEAEALALLQDKRDKIFTVNVWSTREEQFVMTYRRQLKEAA